MATLKDILMLLTAGTAGFLAGKKMTEKEKSKQNEKKGFFARIIDRIDKIASFNIGTGTVYADFIFSRIGNPFDTNQNFHFKSSISLFQLIFRPYKTP